MASDVGSGADRSEGAADSSWEWETNSSWWSTSGKYENWTWVGRQRNSDHSSYGDAYYANWDWERSHDPWRDWYNDRNLRDRSGVSHDSDQGGREEPDHRGWRGDWWNGGETDVLSPKSVPAARDVSGALPSGEMSSVGQQKENKVAGDQRHSKISSSYPPIFRAKPGESFKEWKRSVGFWLGGEAGSLPAELIGPRLMVQLRDRAGQLVHHLSNEDVNKSDGMKLVMDTLEKSPLIRQLDKHKVDMHRKRLMSLRRLPQESLESYVTRGQLYRTQLVALDDAMQMGECFFTGHLLDGARLSRKDKVMIKTRAGSDREVDVTNAMVELAPELEGEHGFPIGNSEPNAAARQGEEFLIQRPENSRFAKKEVNAVEFDPFAEENLEFDDEASLVLEEFDPPELVQAANEAFALQHKAKQRIMEVRKLRQYYRRPDRPEQDERRRALQEKMRTSPCHRCGEIGHWRRECPQRNNAVAATALKGSHAAKTAEEEWSALVSLCHQPASVAASASGAYKERFVGVINHVGGIAHETMWCQQELRLNVILDLGCVKSVVGLAWMNQLVKEWKSRNRWFAVHPEQEKFQFGNGETLTSRCRVQFECMVGGCHIILGMSVVSGKCPPLLSRHACSQLGLKIDCAAHSFSSTRMGIKTFGLSQASNGHYLLPLFDFDENLRSDIPSDFSLMKGQEAQVIKKVSLHSEVVEQPAAVMFELTNDRSIRSSDPTSTPTSADGVGARGSEGEVSGGKAGGRAQDRHLSPLRRSRSPSNGMPYAGASGERDRGGDEGGSGLLGAESEEGDHSPLLSSCTTTPESFDEHRAAFDFGVGAHARPQQGRDCPDQQAPCEGSHHPFQAAGQSSVDRGAGQFSEPLSHVVSGGGDEHGVRDGLSNENLSVEKAALATEGEVGCGSHARSSMEAQSTLASNAAVQGSGCDLGSLRSSSSEVEQPGHPLPDVTREKQLLLQRGMVQSLKQGVGKGLTRGRRITDTAAMESFCGGGDLCRRGEPHQGRQEGASRALGRIGAY